MDKKKIEIIVVGVGIVILVLASLSVFTKKTPGQGAKSQPVQYDPLKAQGTQIAVRAQEVKKEAKRDWGRDPFVLEESGQSATGAGLLKLMGITTGAKPMAVINDEMVKVGSMIGQYKVKRITKHEVIVNDGAKDITLTLD